MPISKLKDFLDSNSVKYTCVSHSPAFTAQEIAGLAHIRGRNMAKTVMVTLDGKMTMVVLPAPHQVDFDKLQSTTGANEVALATEDEFRGLFPQCEPGAMPPFGNLWDMDVYVTSALAQDEEIAFNAGTHTELIRIAFADFEKLVRPKLIQ